MLNFRLMKSSEQIKGRKPELLAPAGNLEKLKVAVNYGADAVYLSGQRFGLRVAADNFTNKEIIQAVNYSARQGVKIYITLNAFAHDEDLEGLAEYCQFLETAGVSAVIVSDLGVLRVVKNSSNLDIHLSTQASCLNVESALAWKALGAKRIVVARELTIEECSLIRQRAEIEIETFCHGAMCMSYSGMCTISNYTSGRDSNRGGCVQSCRFGYEHYSADGTRKKSLGIIKNTDLGERSSTHYMSSKDLNALDLVPQFCQAGLDSLKIEGRMKSPYYVASVCSAYRSAIDQYWEHSTGELPSAASLLALPHRGYTTGSLTAPASRLSVFQQGGSTVINATHKFLGVLLDVQGTRGIIKLHEPLSVGTYIELITASGKILPWTINEFFSPAGDSLNKIHQNTVVQIDFAEISSQLQPYLIVRQPVSQPVLGAVA